MIELPLHAVRRILCLGAHSDDIEIGAGGTLMKIVAGRPDIEIQWVVFSALGQRAGEARRSAADFLARATSKSIRVGEFKDSYFPGEWSAIKQWLEGIKQGFAPDLVFTHYRDDRHQDHRVVSELTWNAFRQHFILEYEVPKYDGDLGMPNVFVRLPDDVAQQKAKLLLQHFQTQGNKHWFTEDLFLSLMRIRGMECGSRHAEAFHGRKIVL